MSSSHLTVDIAMLNAGNVVDDRLELISLLDTNGFTIGDDLRTGVKTLCPRLMALQGEGHRSKFLATCATARNGPPQEPKSTDPVRYLIVFDIMILIYCILSHPQVRWGNLEGQVRPRLAGL